MSKELRKPIAKWQDRLNKYDNTELRIEKKWLRLWIDFNHNSIIDSNELISMWNKKIVNLWEYIND